MGDRANAVFKQDSGYLALYTHNGGYRIKADVANAIDRVIKAGRVNDTGYATRIAISNIIGEGWKGDLNYGLFVGSTIDETITDNGNDIIVVNFEGDKVNIHADAIMGAGNIKESYSLQEFASKFVAR